jgi:hypothetical protein
MPGVNKGNILPSATHYAPNKSYYATKKEAEDITSIVGVAPIHVETVDKEAAVSLDEVSEYNMTIPYVNEITVDKWGRVTNATTYGYPAITSTEASTIAGEAISSFLSTGGTFTGLVSGLTPVDGSNFATKDYVDTSAPSEYAAGSNIAFGYNGSVSTINLAINSTVDVSGQELTNVAKISNSNSDLDIEGDDVNIKATGLTNFLNITAQGAGIVMATPGTIQILSAAGDISIGSGNVLGANTEIEKFAFKDNEMSAVGANLKLIDIATFAGKSCLMSGIQTYSGCNMNVTGTINANIIAPLSLASNVYIGNSNNPAITAVVNGEVKAKQLSVSNAPHQQQLKNNADTGGLNMTYYLSNAAVSTCRMLDDTFNRPYLSNDGSNLYLISPASTIISQTAVGGSVSTWSEYPATTTIDCGTQNIENATSIFLNGSVFTNGISPLPGCNNIVMYDEVNVTDVISADALHLRTEFSSILPTSTINITPSYNGTYYGGLSLSLTGEPGNSEVLDTKHNVPVLEYTSNVLYMKTPHVAAFASTIISPGSSDWSDFPATGTVNIANNDISSIKDAYITGITYTDTISSLTGDSVNIADALNTTYISSQVIHLRDDTNTNSVSMTARAGNSLNVDGDIKCPNIIDGTNNHGYVGAYLTTDNNNKLLWSTLNIPDGSFAYTDVANTFTNTNTFVSTNNIFVKTSTINIPVQPLRTVASIGNFTVTGSTSQVLSGTGVNIIATAVQGASVTATTSASCASISSGTTTVGVLTGRDNATFNSNVTVVGSNIATVVGTPSAYISTIYDAAGSVGSNGNFLKCSTNNLVLWGNGTRTDIYTGTGGAGSYLGGTGTWNKPTGAQLIEVLLIGGGGAGGDGYQNTGVGNAGGGGGGGAGGVFNAKYRASEFPNTVTMTIGQGGTRTPTVQAPASTALVSSGTIFLRTTQAGSGNGGGPSAGGLGGGGGTYFANAGSQGGIGTGNAAAVTVANQNSGGGGGGGSGGSTAATTCLSAAGGSSAGTAVAGGAGVLTTISAGTPGNNGGWNGLYGVACSSGGGGGGGSISGSGGKGGDGGGFGAGGGGGGASGGGVFTGYGGAGSAGLVVITTYF